MKMLVQIIPRLDKCFLETGIVEALIVDEKAKHSNFPTHFFHGGWLLKRLVALKLCLLINKLFAAIINKVNKILDKNVLFCISLDSCNSDCFKNKLFLEFGIKLEGINLFLKESDVTW